ncbi:outer membrane protein assembly factor BamB family protein [Chitinilyticum litopenaei]|uniref:outer membrane protein assembly factor BamB family protein n=1 Tax=Chitinilyticum litopenaei TaxID=1121276 RepID=UPI000403726F|nr:PQQ-binding-like beta-propeller repeat protein [Chitinilyticum litopenaei]
MLKTGSAIALFALLNTACAASTAWSVKTGAPIRGGVLTDANGSVIVGNLAGDVLAFDGTRRQRWHSRIDGAITSTPLRHAGLVIIASSKGVSALQEADGKPRWQHKLGNLGLDQLKSWDSLQADPVAAGKLVLVVFGTQLLALDAASGKQIWTSQLPAASSATPLLTADGILLVDERGQLQIIDAGNGKLLRSTTLARAAIQQAPALSGKLLVYGSRDGKVRAQVPGETRPRWEVDHGSSWIVASPLLDDGLALVGSSDSQLLQGIDLSSGKVRWELPSGQNALRAPVKAGSLYWFAGGDAYSPQSPSKLLAVNASGKIRHSIAMPSALFGQAVVAGDTLWIGGEDGVLHALPSK